MSKQNKVNPDHYHTGGRLSPDQPLPVSDGLLAATGIEHKLTIVTRNTDDFLRSGVNTLNPFLSKPNAD